MIPTVSQVVTKIQSLLGDDAGRVFDTALATDGYMEAYRYLRQAMIQDQIPAATKVVTWVFGAGLGSLTPADAGISDFGELIEIAERRAGTTDDWVPLLESEGLLNGSSGSSLGIFEWREDTFYFYASTNTQELRIRYYDSGSPPLTGPVGIDGSFDFLTCYGAAQIGPSRGYDPNECLRLERKALGPRLDGSGGLLYSLLQPMVRSLQRVQQQPLPYTAGRPSWRRARPSLYIAAPPTQGTVTQVLTISGVQDGENPTFQLSQLPQFLELFKNGVLMYPGVSYVLNGTVVTFAWDAIPQSYDLLRAQAIV